MKLYRQPNSKVWSADFRIRGKRIRQSTGEITKAKAFEVAADLHRELQRGETPSLRRLCPTLQEFAHQHFLPYIEAHSSLAATTKDYYRLGMAHLDNAPLSRMRLDAIRKPHIETLQVTGSNATINRSLRTLRRCLNIAHELDFLSKVPRFSLVEETGRSVLITTDTEGRIAESMKGTRRKSALQIGLYIILDCGLRPKEIAGLDLTENIRLAEGVIFVSRRISKTRKGERTVPMTLRVRELLTQRLNTRTTGWVFPSPKYPERHIQSRSLTAQWRVHAKKVGLPRDVNLYCARHTFGTDVMAATKNPFLTQKLMGHSDLSTTGRYQHPELGAVGKLMDERNQNRKSAIVLDIGERRAKTG